MRIAAWLGLVGLLLLTAESLEAGSSGNYYARLRANDAPLAGRFSIYAYMLDSLDTALDLPGRVIALNFRESNGKNSFLIPADLALGGLDQTSWIKGFVALGEKRISGFLGRDDSRWALWWIPADSLGWNSPGDISVRYGFVASSFVPLDDKDAEATVNALPWDDIYAAELSVDRTTAQLRVAPNPAAFDQFPRAKIRRDPVYPKTSRMYAFEGTVHVVAVVDVEGNVTDTYVLHTSATHDLNVSALVAVRKWVFRPGKKGGVKVSGEVIVPVQFAMGAVR